MCVSSRARLRWLVALGLLACGGDGGGGGGGPLPVETTEFLVLAPRDGSRLKLRWAVTEDGTRLPWDFHDSELNVDCWFQRTSDGKWRCLPRSMVAERRFADDKCTVPVLVPSASCPQSPFLMKNADDDGCSPAPIDKVFPLVNRAKPAYTYRPAAYDATVCVGAGPPGPDVMAYELGSELPLDRFVSAVERRRPGANLDLAFFEASDGARAFSGWRAGGQACRPYETVDGTLRCLDDAFYTTDTFAEESCSEPVWFVGRCGEPRHVGVRAAGCPPRYEVHGVGDPVVPVFRRSRPAVPLSEPAPTTCTLAAAAPGSEHRRLLPMSPDVAPLMKARPMERPGEQLWVMETSTDDGVAVRELFDPIPQATVPVQVRRGRRRRLRARQPPGGDVFCRFRPVLGR